MPAGKSEDRRPQSGLLDALPFVHLASRSPRRAALLEQMGVRFDLLEIEVDESSEAGESPARYVERIALAKALAGAARLGDPGAVVLGADTIVVVDGAVLGKPRDEDDARMLLARLSGRSHRVLSAAAIAGRRQASVLSESEVWFRELSARERDAYVASGEPMDKAGAYAIQGRGAIFVSRLEGSYSGVMGLPVYEVYQLLRQASD